ncbi:excalibur calcium-binding domain-containing protein [Nocardioides sp.]|uniref:excalibur calcium-binding domain-containing protein n=1 Tax=Nocardioides sp. TaxID=35761 RepID=UPI0027356F41|nr:excalibur calcium-binding domain-containing protein [Nocardioides sp.]MDP3894426.1 excalibur calcium-binding domain-containing protein [Nocardioides sp.]
MGFIKTAGIGLGALFLIGACLGGTGDDADGDKESAGTSKSDSKIDAKTEGDDSGATEDSEPTQHEVWSDNYADRDERIQKTLTRRLPAYQQPMDAVNESLASCDEIAEGRALRKRLKNAGARWSAKPDQAIVVLTVVADNVCPDVAKTHTKQVEQKRKADARAAARRRAAAAKAERQRQAQLQQQSQQVYYANCTEVEAAGAAPIYAGDSGYSRDLDRDGDGVACEQ